MGASGLRTHIWNNNAKSLLLLAGFPILLVMLIYAGLLILGVGMAGDNADIGRQMSGSAQALPSILPWALGAAGIWFVIAWFFHQAMIDAATGARKVDRLEEPGLYNLLENLCISRGMTMPHLRIIETPAMNAYASGLREGQYSVTVTRGLMQNLEKDELEAVLAHELSHIRHSDVRMLVIAIIFVGIISFAAEMVFRGMFYGGATVGRSRRGGGGGALIIIAFVIIAIAWVLAILIRFSLSRKREYMADAGAVELTKNPDAMIRALQKISGHAEIKDSPAEVREMFIENAASGFTGLFATHPPIEKRIDALRDYAGGSPAVSSVPVG